MGSKREVMEVAEENSGGDGEGDGDCETKRYNYHDILYF